METFAHTLELGRWDSKVEQTVFLANIATRVINIKDTLITLLFIESIVKFGEIFITIILTRLIIANRKEMIDALRFSLQCRAKFVTEGLICHWRSGISNDRRVSWKKRVDKERK